MGVLTQTHNGLKFTESPANISYNTTNIITITSGGNVGIGTTSPGSALDVYGNINSTGWIAAGNYVVTPLFYNSGNHNTLNKAGGGWISWATRDTSGTETVINLSSIGTFSSSGNATFSSSVTAVRGFFNTGGNETDPIISVTGDNNTGFFFPAADTIATTTGGAERMRITSGGNVGIGVTAPGAKLDVVGDSDGSVILKLQRNGIGAYQYFVTDAGAGAQQLFCDAQQADSGFVFRTRDASNNTITALYLAPSGNVGIGTTSPTSKLHVQGTSYFFDQSIFGDKVGIGTTSPETALHVIGEISLPSTIRLTAAGANNAYISESWGINLNGNTQWPVQVRSASFSVGYTLGGGTSYGNNNMFVAGSVGIGTTSPSGKFNVHNGAIRNTSSDGSQLTINSEGGSGGSAYIEAYNNTSSQFKDLLFYGKDIIFRAQVSSEVERMRITSAGNVGIGTTSPGYRLHVQDTGTSGTVAIGADAYPMLLFSDATTGEFRLDNRNSAGAGFISFYPNGQAGTIGSEAMRINTNGNVGIGTTSPGAKLDVSGDLSVRSGATIGDTSTASSATNYESILRVKGKNNYSDGTTWYGDYGQIILHSTSNMTDSARRFMITNALDNSKFAIVRSADSNTDPSVNATDTGVNSGTADFVINNAGNVGIGTTNPTLGLHVGDGKGLIVGGSGNTGSMYVSPSDENTINGGYGQAADTADIWLNYRGYQDGFSYFRDTRIGDGKGTAIVMVDGSAGNVGIGTTSPTEKLHVEGRIRIGSTPEIVSHDNITFVIDQNANSGTNFLNVMGGAVELFRIQQDGNVGIGTTSPVSRLHVAGRIAGGELGNPNITRNGLTLYLDFNDKACHSGGSEAPIDLSPSNYTIGITGGANFEYKDGIGVYYFDNTADHIDVTNFYRGDNGVTYEAWVYADALSGWDTFFDSGGTERPLLGFLSGALRAYPATETFFTASAGRWYHIAFAFASDSDLDVYVNGYRVSDGYDWSNGGSWTSRAGTFNLWIGGDTSTETFNGYIAIARTYSRQLQPQELLQNYNAEVSRFATVTPALGINHSYDKVGIGTTSPAYPLEVAGVGTVSIAYQRTGVAAKKWGFHSDNSNTYWHNITDNVLALTVSNAGNVGIGSTAPAAKLNVASTGANAYSSTITKGTNMKGIINALSNNADDMVGVYFGTGTTSEGTHWSGITGSRSQSATDWSTQLNFYTHNEDVANINDATQKMVIKGNGNVGIGTASPGAKLEIGAAGDGVIAAKLTQGYEKVRMNTIDLLAYNDGHFWMIGNNNPSIVLGSSWDWDRQIEIAYAPGTTGQGAGVLSIGQSDKNNSSFTHGVTNFLTNGIERMRITAAGNVGIGTTSPTKKLHVVSSSNEGIFMDGSANGGHWFDFKSANSNLWSMGAQPGLMGWYNRTDSSYKMVITDGGNVGIGVTPSNWSTVAPILQIGTGGAFIGGQGSANVIRAGVNIYYDGSNWRYINSGAASWFEAVSGAFGWYSSPSGNAGDVASVNNLMNLSADGRLGIGTTSPAYKLDVSGGAIAIRGNTAGNSLRFDDSTGTSRNALYVDTSNYLNISNSNYAGVKFVQTATAPSTQGFEGNAIQQAFGVVENGTILAQPDAWLAVRVGTTDYAIPMYTTG